MCYTHFAARHKIKSLKNQQTKQNSSGIQTSTGSSGMCIYMTSRYKHRGFPKPIVLINNLFSFTTSRVQNHSP